MGWWFGRKSAPADARPYVPAWLQCDAAEEGFARSRERAEQYDVTVTLGAEVVEYSCSAPALTVAAGDLLSLGAGTATIAVRQIGDWGASRPAQTQITLG